MLLAWVQVRLAFMKSYVIKYSQRFNSNKLGFSPSAPWLTYAIPLRVFSSFLECHHLSFLDIIIISRSDTYLFVNSTLINTSTSKFSALEITSFGIFHILPELQFGFPLNWNLFVVQILCTVNVYGAFLTVISEYLVNEYMKYVMKAQDSDSRFHRNP